MVWWMPRGRVGRGENGTPIARGVLDSAGPVGNLDEELVGRED
jgi:hypothetical protein